MKWLWKQPNPLECWGSGCLASHALANLFSSERNAQWVTEYTIDNNQSYMTTELRLTDSIATSPGTKPQPLEKVSNPTFPIFCSHFQHRTNPQKANMLLKPIIIDVALLVHVNNAEIKLPRCSVFLFSIKIASSPAYLWISDKHKWWQ